MEIQVTIETHDNMLLFEMLEVRKTTQGMEKEVDPELKVRWDSTYIRKALGLPEIIRLTLKIGSDIAIGVAAAWLYDKLKGKATKLEIERTEVQIDKGEITRILTEKAKKSD